jgi:hypothetical protein
MDKILKQFGKDKNIEAVKTLKIELKLEKNME